jgi:hypothetical protein
MPRKGERISYPLEIGAAIGKTAQRYPQRRYIARASGADPIGHIDSGISE